MSEDKPFGWRPLSDEQKEKYRQDGWNEDAIAGFEARNIYAPIDTAVLAYEISIATLVVAARRHGAAFIHDVRSELEVSSDKAAASENVEDRVEAEIVRTFVKDSDWESLVMRASAHSDG